MIKLTAFAFSAAFFLIIPFSVAALNLFSYRSEYRYLNVNFTGSDLHYDKAVSDLSSIPEEHKVQFSYEAGFYQNPFDLGLSVPDTSYDIAYTIDCSNPITSSTRILADNSAVIHIDPAITVGRGATPGFVVRASLIKDGYKPSFPVSCTYIFLEKVKTQAYPGVKWPKTPVNGQVFDYEMSSEVVNNISYHSLIDDALVEIPAISVSTDMANLFDPAVGIYVNAGGRAIGWERDCSFEIIYPGGTTGFQTNAGLRIRGGFSRTGNNPKHSFRLFFREEYGAGKLLYPLFGEEGVSEFDNIDLRAEQNYSWNADADENIHNSLVRDIFSRDSQRDIDQPYSRGRYYHLYLNGMYWGIYQTDERTEASFAESYFGDDKEDYDVVKVSPTTWPYTNEVTDGNDDAWEELWKMCLHGFTNNQEYYALEGKDANGNPVKESKVLVDIDNLIDYMILIFYTGNFDAPTSAFNGNKMPNNYYAIYNREDKGKGFIFLAHDSEHSLMKDYVFVGQGLYEDRVNIAYRDDWLKMDVSSFNYFHPQWLHQKLLNIADYRARFANRAYKYLGQDGSFTPEKSVERLIYRVNQIDTAIIAESARWGHIHSSPSRTKDNAWLPEIDVLLNEVLQMRTDITIDQLKELDLYPDLNAPAITVSGKAINVTDYYFDGPFSMTISNPDNIGTIYYTLDGSDPRQPGGGISPIALAITGGSTLPVSASTAFKVRIINRGSWSAMREVNFLKNQEDYANLKITEIHYHPPDIIEGTDTIDGKDLEFIELKNIGETALNISGIKFDSAVLHTVPAATVLAPLNFYVVASKPQKFYDQYGRYPSGNNSGNLSNSGEYILLSDALGNTILSLTYDDNLPWPANADGEGYSLAANDINPSGDPALPEYWHSSFVKGGSPFADDSPLSSIPETYLTEFTVYPNPTNNKVTIEFPGSEINNWILELSDQSGRILYSAENTGKSVQLDLISLNLTHGVYFLKIAAKGEYRVEKLVYIP